ncbi:MAG TPA: NAD-dependent epimerase/dehydratase family protein, partial [Thermoanaerobaculia bacterium]|nr:NAD-dependent epimerase/dehydratase family protein [Thermoanaerobaculia bacterium]
MRTFVTGAGGFLGSHLVARLLVHGDAVAGTYPSGMAAPAGVEAYELDILDTAALHRAFHHFEPEIVVHLAGLAHVGASWQHREEYFRVNVEGTERLVEAAAGRPVVLASSAEVYGPVPEAEQPIEESRPLAPASPYAETKVAAEERVLAAGGRALRTFNLIGPGQSPSFALPSFARQLAAIARGEAPPVLRVGNLSARRDFVHVADGVEAYRLVAERGEAGGV